MHADFCSTLNINVDFIRLFDCINCIKMFGGGWPYGATGESTREKGRKEDWRRERGGLDPQHLWQVAATAACQSTAWNMPLIYPLNGHITSFELVPAGKRLTGVSGNVTYYQSVVQLHVQIIATKRANVRPSSVIDWMRYWNPDTRPLNIAWHHGER